MLQSDSPVKTVKKFGIRDSNTHYEKQVNTHKYIFLTPTHVSVNTWAAKVITLHPLAVVSLLCHQHYFREELTQAEPKVIILFNGQ